MKEIKNSSQGFTLLELLVVVLIIGILAAIALPQYKNARDKAVISAFLPMINAIKEAEEVYFMTHGEYARNLETLDIDVTKDGSCSKYHNMMFCKKEYINLSYNGSTLTGALSFFYCPSFTEKMDVYNYSSCASTKLVKATIYLSNHSTKPNRVECSGPSKLCEMFT